jgi:hypothetical protein
MNEAHLKILIPMKKLHILIVITAFALSSCSGFSQQTAEKEAPCCASEHDHSSQASNQESYTIEDNTSAIVTNHGGCNHESSKACDAATDHVTGSDCAHDQTTAKAGGHIH